MTTPIIMIALLIVPCFVAEKLNRRRGTPWAPAFAGALGLGILFMFTGLGHFVRTGPMAEMLPPWVPYSEALVYVTGIIEFAIAGALFSSRFRRFGAVAAMVVLVGFFPANVYAALNHIGMGGHQWGPEYLLIRAPLQMLLIYWAFVRVYRQA